MKKRALLLSVLLMPQLGFANFQFDKQINSIRLQEELKDQNFNIDHIHCLGTRCTLVWGPGGETKNPAAIINNHQYIDLEEQRAAQRDSIRALADKWRQGTITPAE
jgi:hypothetical protein